MAKLPHVPTIAFHVLCLKNDDLGPEKQGVVKREIHCKVLWGARSPPCVQDLRADACWLVREPPSLLSGSQPPSPHP
jgi:hypothetical protein